MFFYDMLYCCLVKIIQKRDKCLRYVSLANIMFEFMMDQAISKWVDAAEADFDSMFQVMFDVLGITEAIHKDAEALSDSDSDTLTPLNDVTLDDLLLDDLDGSDTDTGDPL